MSNSHVSPVLSSILSTIGGGSVVTDDLAAMVDQLGALDAEIKALTKRADALKADIKKHGPERYNGSIFSALVYESEGRVSTDWRAIAEHFKPSRQLITAHTSTGEASRSIKLEKI